MSIKRITRRRIAAPIMEYADNRTGGDVETKFNPPEQKVQSRAGTNIETRTNTEVETRHDTGSKDAPTLSRWSA